ncbi:MAG: choice-of-anchor V domain-containing protein [Panacagrimonas sp.]
MASSGGRRVARVLASLTVLSASGTAPVWANNAGLVGHSTAANNCTSSCHGGGAFDFSTGIQGPTMLTPGAAGSLSVRMTRESGSGDVFGGFGLSANGGTLNSSDAGVSKFGNELVQNDRRSMNDGSIA